MNNYTCNWDENQVTLAWSPPSGQVVEIEYYLVDVAEPAEITCPLDQCNVTTTNTTITGLLCNTSYTVTVTAVNCRGKGTVSDAISIGIHECKLLLCYFYIKFVEFKLFCHAHDVGLESVVQVVANSMQGTVLTGGNQVHVPNLI